MRNQVEHLIPSMILLVFMIGIPPLLAPKLNNPESVGAIYLISYLFFGVPVVTALLIHIRYYFNDKSTKVTITKDDVLVNKNNDSISFNLADVKEYTVYQTLSVRYGGVRFIPTENYNFCNILLNNGEKIKLTTLIDPDFQVLSNLLSEKATLKLRPLCIF